MPDLRKQYKEEVLPQLRTSRGYPNVNMVPKLRKIIISTGISSSVDRDAFPEAKQVLSMITGQAAVITKSRTNISNFKLRKGMPVGVIVTLRNDRMYEFFDRLVHNVLPRVRDFRGVPRHGFDGQGNYSMGVTDISVFTEIDLDKLKRPFGLNVTIVTSAATNEEAFELLRLMGMPFAE